MAAYHICRVSQDGIDRGLHGHQPAPPVGGLQVLLQVGVVVEGHPALVAHDVLRLQMHFVDVLGEVRVLALAVGAFGLGGLLKVVTIKTTSITPLLLHEQSEHAV